MIILCEKYFSEALYLPFIIPNLEALLIGQRTVAWLIAFTEVAIHATSLTMSAFGLTPLPPWCGRPL